jgi:peptide/nickel transport system substrate-binding protein
MKLSKRSPVAALISATAAFAATAVALTGCAQSSQEAKPSTLTLGSVVTVTSWEPSQADIGHGIQYYQAVYDNLILREPSGEYSPNLATAWTINDASSEIELDLRTDVKFSDGEAFNADAAVANLEAFIDGNGPQAATFAGAEATKVDDDTIKLTLATPNPDILYYLSTTNSFMASPKSLGTEGLKTTPVGSGPYIFDSEASVAGSKTVLTANPEYWDKDKQKFSKVTFVFMDQVATRLNALRSGQIDATILDVPNSDTATAAGLTLTTYNTDWSGLLLFDRDGKVNPALGKLEVRQAIAHAIDREALLNAVQKGKGKVTGQVFSEASGVYDADLDSVYGYDPEKSRELLAAAGYPNGFTLQMPYNPFLEPMAAFLQTNLEEVGIKVDWVTATDYRAEMLSGKYGAAWFQLFQGTAYVNYNLVIAPDGPRNVLKSTDATINAIDASLKNDATAENVAVQIKKANQHVVDNAWFVPFYTVPQMYFNNDKVTTKAQVQNAVPYLYSYAPTGN